MDVVCLIIFEKVYAQEGIHDASWNNVLHEDDRRIK